MVALSDTQVAVLKAAAAGKLYRIEFAGRGASTRAYQSWAPIGTNGKYVNVTRSVRVLFDRDPALIETGTRVGNRMELKISSAGAAELTRRLHEAAADAAAFVRSIGRP